MMILTKHSKRNDLKGCLRSGAALGRELWPCQEDEEEKVPGRWSEHCRVKLGRKVGEFRKQGMVRVCQKGRWDLGLMGLCRCRVWMLF